MEFKIVGLFEYLMNNNNFRNSDYYNNEFDDNFKAQKTYLKDEGWNHINNVIEKILEGTQIECKTIEKKYNKSNSQKYINITLINNDTNIYSNKFQDLKNMQYQLGNELFKYSLILI